MSSDIEAETARRARSAGRQAIAVCIGAFGLFAALKYRRPAAMAKPPVDVLLPLLASLLICAAFVRADVYRRREEKRPRDLRDIITDNLVMMIGPAFVLGAFPPSYLVGVPISAAVLVGIVMLIATVIERRRAARSQPPPK